MAYLSERLLLPAVKEGDFMLNIFCLYTEGNSLLGSKISGRNAVKTGGKDVGRVGERTEETLPMDSDFPTSEPSSNDGFQMSSPSLVPQRCQQNIINR